MPKGKELTAEQKAAKQAEKAAKFKTLAAKRLANAEKAISLLGNLASYKPTTTQTDFIFGRLAEAAKSAHGRFQSGKPAASEVVIPD